MDAQVAKRLSRKMSFVLRHRPTSIGLTMDPSGWVEVEALVEGLRYSGFTIPTIHGQRWVTMDDIERIVRTNDKQRFELQSLSSDRGARIRARQGHSVSVDLGYAAMRPPSILYHGTTERFLSSILHEGLVKGKRHHVHLTEDVGLARKTGGRRGSPVVLAVKAEALETDGAVFYKTGNNVWLIDAVPARYLEIFRDGPMC